MKTLQNMAADRFNEYSRRETGKPGNWAYLSPKRQKEWMKEVLDMSNYFLDNLKADFKPIPHNIQSSTVYESGFNDGVRSERTYYINKTDELHQKLLEEYDNFDDSKK